LSRIWWHIKKRLKYNHSSHDFRHTKATILSKVEKWEAPTLKAFMGHKSIATTLGYVTITKEEACSMANEVILQNPLFKTDF
jgi:integrase